ncbi:MAG: peptidoglycan-binding domain-containing protein [Minisyncoccia bacterium]
MRKLAVSVSVAPLIFLSLFSLTHAQSNTQLQGELSALLQQLAALQAQLQIGTPAPSPTATGTYGQCPALYRALRVGVSGSDVSALQAFLANDRNIYPEGTVSGYFGALTQVAVQRFQARHGLVSSGAPDTTGYGMVGPGTRNLIASVCRSTTPQQPTTSNCLVNGVAMSNGSTANFYSLSFVPQGSSCDSYRQTRQCVNGSLSGNPVYSYGSCVVGQSNIPGSCTIDGETLMNGQTRSLFKRDFVSYGGQCEQSLRTCSNGVLTGPSDYRYTACNVAEAPSSCSLDGKAIAHGSSMAFYTQKDVLFGQNCSSFVGTRACDNGDLKGDTDYRYATCSAAGAKSCTVVATIDGKPATTTVAHGSSRDFWSRESVAYTNTCESFKLTRTCNDGLLSGAAANKFPSCEVIPEKTCAIDGITVAGGATRTFYSARSVVKGGNCTTIQQARKCTNGVLGGTATYQYAYCAPVGQRYCLLDGTYVAHGAARAFYSTENTVFGSDCSQFDLSRTCADGTLSGPASYQYASCKNASGASCALDGATIAHNASAKFYSTRTAPSGENCGMYEQLRICVNGSLSGSSSFKYKACTAPTADSGSSAQVAAALSAMEALLKDALIKLDSWF